MDIPAQNGIYMISTSQSNKRYHDLGLSIPATVIGGTLNIEGRKPGANFFESVTESTINLAAPNTIQFEGAVIEFRFTITNINGSGTITITDTAI